MPVEMQLASATETLESSDSRLVDLVDGLLDHGVAIRGELWLSVADVDLVFLGLDVVLATPDRMRPAGALQ
ncbi:gas vesicle protein [Cognatiyoonia sp. IB215182]|uniref:gas vesicle protein n=1 Tax=Cognatiyoonia sp. IB215182 TaxID=3097353 RepID=UPI002A0B3609|nr:gas vesicle protein [Cognatiyoonia sp. IB215182]MDX8351418.1 gas vesicle protein [Cognatiyoonia sp. IB215182]